MRRIALVAVLLASVSACGQAPSPIGNDGADQEPGSQAQPGEFADGSATIRTPSGEATLAFSEGLYISANDTVVANFADGDSTDPDTNSLGVNGSTAGMSITLIGPLQPQGVSTECTVSASKIEPSGLEGTFECDGGVSGTFEAH